MTQPMLPTFTPAGMRDLLGRALWSGSLASVLSTIALAWAARRETGRPAAAANATSHWIWGERAAHQDRLSLRYTALGYTIHHAAAVFWACFFERWFGARRDRGELGATLAGSAAVATLACVVDYTITPPRLTPGYEKRLSRPALALAYAAFGAGLAATLIGARTRARNRGR